MYGQGCVHQDLCAEYKCAWLLDQGIIFLRLLQHHPVVMATAKIVSLKPHLWSLICTIHLWLETYINCIVLNFSPQFLYMVYVVSGIHSQMLSCVISGVGIQGLARSIWPSLLGRKQNPAPELLKSKQDDILKINNYIHSLFVTKYHISMTELQGI